MARANTMRARRRRRGFTIVEVMVSLGIMTIGAMGVIALQTHTIRANSHARQLTIGMQIAQRWIERLKQDTQTWNQVGVPTATLAGTRYLQLVNTAPNAFSQIPNTDGTTTASRGFDYMGNDIVDTADPLRPLFYCASLRPAWVYFGRAMRVDVRVWWPREGFDTRREFGGCAPQNYAQLNPGGAATTLYNQSAFHVVYLSTVLRVNPVKR